MQARGREAARPGDCASQAAALQFSRSYYAGGEEERLRELMTKQQYVAHIKSRSDADRGMSGYHGVAKRKNGRWQSRITGVAVRLALCKPLCTRPVQSHVLVLSSVCTAVSTASRKGDRAIVAQPALWRLW